MRMMGLRGAWRTSEDRVLNEEDDLLGSFPSLVQTTPFNFFNSRASHRIAGLQLLCRAAQGRRVSGLVCV